MSQASLSFIISALQEYNEYLGRLVSRLSNIADKLKELEGEQEWSKKLKKAEERLFTIEAEFSEFINYFSSFQRGSPSSYLPSLTSRYKTWEDFKTQSTNAKWVSFLLEEKERVFQVCVLKEDRVLTYSGEFPQHAELLKSWLSIELGTRQEKIVEGVLAMG